MLVCPVWNNGVTNGVPFSVNQSQTYTVIGNSNGCTDTAQVTVTVNPTPIVSAGQNQSVCAGTSVTLNASGANTYSWNNNVQNGVAFTPSATQSYTVTGIDANGCTNTAQVTVTVNSLPTVSAGQNQAVCAGTSVTLSGSGANTYTWNNNVQNGVAFTPSTTQTYSLVGTDGNGCQGTDQVLVEVFSPSSETLNVTECTSYSLNGQTYTQSGIYTQSLTNYLGCDSTITLNLTINNLPASPVVNTSNDNTLSTTSQGNATFQWIFCSTGLAIANETDSVFVPTVNGVYAVTVTNGCGTVTSNCVTIANMGLNAIEALVELFPNPSLDLVHITGLANIQTPYQLKDALGRVVRTGTFNGSNETLDLIGLSLGNYRLTIEGIGSFSIVKQ